LTTRPQRRSLDIYDDNINIEFKEIRFESVELIHVTGYLPVAGFFEHGNELL
jgi:hypothetical protein